MRIRRNGGARSLARQLDRRALRQPPERRQRHFGRRGTRRGLVLPPHQGRPLLRRHLRIDLRHGAMRPRGLPQRARTSPATRTRTAPGPNSVRQAGGNGLPLDRGRDLLVLGGPVHVDDPAGRLPALTAPQGSFSSSAPAPASGARWSRYSGDDDGLLSGGQGCPRSRAAPRPVAGGVRGDGRVGSAA